MTKNLKTQAVNKDEYVVYWNKAEEFYEVMKQAYKGHLWTAVGLNAVHCAISMCDAVLVYSLGLRFSGEDHMQAAELLRQAPVREAEKQVSSLRRIIAKKNVVAYEGREFRESDASDIFKQAERFYQWGCEYLNKK